MEKEKPRLTNFEFSKFPPAFDEQQKVPKGSFISINSSIILSHTDRYKQMIMGKIVKQEKKKEKEKWGYSHIFPWLHNLRCQSSHSCNT